MARTGSMRATGVAGFRLNGTVRADGGSKTLLGGNENWMQGGAGGGGRVAIVYNDTARPRSTPEICPSSTFRRMAAIGTWNNSNGDYGGWGGGAIRIFAEFDAIIDGTLTANGQSITVYGGGRIAIWRRVHRFYGTANQPIAGNAGNGDYIGDPGTIHWEMVPPRGTILMMR